MYKTYYKFVPDELLKKAYFTSDKNEAAWFREEVLLVIDILTKNNIAIIGGEVWFASKPGPTMGDFDFYVDYEDKGTDESWEEFVLRVNKIHKEYIAKYEKNCFLAKYFDRFKQCFNFDLNDEEEWKTLKESSNV